LKSWCAFVLHQLSFGVFLFLKCKNNDAKSCLLAIFIDEVATQSSFFVFVYRIVVTGNNLQQHSEKARNCEKERTVMKIALVAAVVASLACAVNLTVAQELAKAPLSVPAAAKVADKAKLNINQASIEQLVAVPGIGEKKAQAIKDYISANGPIKDQKQLTEVKGIGDKLAAKVAEHVSF
jgi:competence protein ComEA